MILGKCTLSDTLKNVVYRRIIFMCSSAKYAIAVNTQKKKKSAKLGKRICSIYTNFLRIINAF